MSDEIPPLPVIPAALRIAARRGGALVPFIGAGVSRLAGCPNWAEFADGAIQFFIGKGKFSHSQHDQIRALTPRVKMSVALGLQEEYSLPIDFRTLLHPPGSSAQTDGEQLYAFLGELASTFVTTNYDEWLDYGIAFPAPMPGVPEPGASTPTRSARRSIYKLVDLTYENLNTPNTVIHLHGSLNDAGGMILTTRNYVSHYANDRFGRAAGEENPVLTFLENLFREKNVLFIGYGLEELEILEYVVLKAKRDPKSLEEPRHFIIQGFFSHERELMRSMRRYYLADCGIELMPFLRDQKNWHQLIDVVEYLARELPARPPLTSEELKGMEGLLGG